MSTSIINITDRFEYCRRIRRAIILLDDIDDIVSHLRANCQNVGIYAGQAQAEDGTDDLLSATLKEMAQVDILSVGPSIEVRLGMLGAYIGTTDKSPRASAIVDEIHSLTSEREHFYGIPLLVSIVVLVMSIYWIIGGEMILSTGAYSAVTGPIFYTAMTLIIAGFIMYEAHRAGNVIIIRSRRKERLTNRRGIQQQVFLALCAALISALVTAVVAGHWIR